MVCVADVSYVVILPRAFCSLKCLTKLKAISRNLAQELRDDFIVWIVDVGAEPKYLGRPTQGKIFDVPQRGRSVLNRRAWY